MQCIQWYTISQPAVPLCCPCTHYFNLMEQMGAIWLEYLSSQSTESNQPDPMFTKYKLKRWQTSVLVYSLEIFDLAAFGIQKLCSISLQIEHNTVWTAAQGLIRMSDLAVSYKGYFRLFLLLWQNSAATQSYKQLYNHFHLAVMKLLLKWVTER